MSQFLYPSWLVGGIITCGQRSTLTLLIVSCRQRPKGSEKGLDTGQEFNSIRDFIFTSNTSLQHGTLTQEYLCCCPIYLHWDHTVSFVIELQKWLNSLMSISYPTAITDQSIHTDYHTVAHHIYLQTLTLIFNFPGGTFITSHLGFNTSEFCSSVEFWHSWATGAQSMDECFPPDGLFVSSLCLCRPKRLCHHSFSPYP